MSRTVDQLLAEGRIQRVRADKALALNLLADAENHLLSTEAILNLDRTGAYQLAYDAARKAVAAHMLAAGLRVRPEKGSHQAVVEYARSELADTDFCAEIGYLDRMRRNRNQAEYLGRGFGEAEVRGAIVDARRIVAGIRTLLEGRRPHEGLAED